MTKNPVEDILRQHGPSLSSAVSRQLVARGLSNEAARKRLSRSQPPVRRLHGLTLPNREAFFYLDEQYGSELYLSRLAEALKSTGSASGRALLGLEARGGVIMGDWFPIVSGLPVKRSKGHVPHETVALLLTKHHLVFVRNTPEGEEIESAGGGSPAADCRAVRAVENAVLEGVGQWLMKLNLVSANTFKTRSQGLPLVGQFAWDFSSPCYAAALRRTSPDSTKPQPGFIFGDIVLGREIFLADLKPFFAKWDTLLNQKRKDRLQAVFVADSFDPDALNELRKRGCLLAFPSVVFGEEASKLLRELVETVKAASAILVRRGEGVFEVFDQLKALTGASLNLRGALLEFIAAWHFKAGGYYVDIRHPVHVPDGRRTDIDVKAHKANEAVCVECKGKMPGVQVDQLEIQKWLDHGLPTIKEWLKTSSLPETRRFEFWAPSGYTDGALQLIEQVQKNHIRQPVAFLNRSAIEQALRAGSGRRVAASFAEHFTKPKGMSEGSNQ